MAAHETLFVSPRTGFGVIWGFVLLLRMSLAFSVFVFVVKAEGTNKGTEGHMPCRLISRKKSHGRDRVREETSMLWRWVAKVKAPHHPVIPSFARCPARSGPDGSACHQRAAARSASIDEFRLKLLPSSLLVWRLAIDTVLDVGLRTQRNAPMQARHR